MLSADGGVGNVFEIACPACEIFALCACQYRPCCPAEVSRGGNEAEERELRKGASWGGVKGGKVIRLLASNPARSPYFGAASRLWVKFSRAAVYVAEVVIVSFVEVAMSQTMSAGVLEAD